MEENKCPQCGAKMKSNAKFCIFCGYINYDAPGNEDFKNLVIDKKILKKQEKEKRKKEKEARKNPNETFIQDSSLNNYSKIKKEKEHKIREKLFNIFQRIWKLLLVTFIIVGIYLIYLYIVHKQNEYVEDAKGIINEFKTKYESNDFSKCDGSGKYYFKFGIEGELENLYEIKVESPFNGVSYIGYVEVVKGNNGYDYYISITDGVFGINKTNIKDIKSSSVIPLDKVDFSNTGDSCR